MSPVLLLLIGAVLCFLGVWSIRVTVLAGGFGTGWVLAEVFDADWTTALVVAGAAAAVAFVATLVVSKVVFFVAGVVVGSVVGAKLFVVVSPDEPEWLLALVFVPAVAVVAGVLADRWERPFLRWATAAAGASMILSGLGRLGTDSTDLFWRPETTGGAALFTAAWVVLAVVGHRVQAGLRDDDRTG